MQKSGHQQGIGVTYNPGQYSASPQDSTYTSRSDNLHKSRPSSAKARGVAGSFFSCFVPCGANPAKAADDEYSTTLSHSYLSYSERPIIHRDIKASNILLTENLRAKVTDFGSAHIASEHQDESHISTQVRGSAGYVDPEYIRTFQLTDKSDVYSFGILLVELVTGRHPIEGKRNPKERLTAKWALQKLKEGEIVLAMDPRLRRSPAAITAVENVMVLAAECLSPSRRTRPAMKKCGEALWRIRKEFREMQLCPLTPSH